MERCILHTLFLATFCVAFNAYAAKTPPKTETQPAPPSIGNFSLPNSQQPGGLIAIGENVVSKGQKQIYLVIDDFKGIDQNALEVIPAFVYGLRDDLSLLITVPYAIHFQIDPDHSTGIQDANAQLEYTYYTKSNHCFTDQATVLTRLSVPTGSADKNPATGNGGYSFMLGTTFIRTFVDWVLFTSYGYNWTIARQGNKFGNTLLYQFGLGRNICSVVDKYIFSWILELDGTYAQKNRVHGVIDTHSGGNIIMVTPSLWYSTQHLIFQAGIGFPITQNWFDGQKNQTLLGVISIGWTF